MTDDARGSSEEGRVQETQRVAGSDPLDRLLRTSLTWRRSDRGRGTYVTDVGGAELFLKRDPFTYPELGLFKLYRDGQYLGSFDGWPRRWRLVGWFATWLHRLLWANVL